MDIDQEMLTRFNYDPDLLKMVIIGNESWVCGHDTKTKIQLLRFVTIEEINEKSKQEQMVYSKARFKRASEI